MSLILVIPETPFTRALLDGSVRVEGFEVTFDPGGHSGPRASARLRGRIEPEVCGAEQVIPDYLVRLANGTGQPLVALPVFPTRGMVHGKYIARPDGPGPGMLSGARVGMSRVLAATAVYLRGVLADEYGLQRERARWVAAEPHTSDEALGSEDWPYLSERLGVRAPELLGLLARGELDAVLYPGGGGGNWYFWLGGSSSGDGTSHYGDLESLVTEHRLALPLARSESILEWFRTYRVYPLFHMLALHREVAERHAGLVEALVEAFAAAATRAPDHLDMEQRRLYEREMELLGEDPNATGLTPLNARSVEYLLDILQADGAIQRRPSLDELFPVGRKTGTETSDKRPHAA